MFKAKKFDFKTITTFILAVTMCLTMGMLVACNKNDSPDSSSSSSSSSTSGTSVTDYQTLKNGDFEFGTTESTTFPYNSSSNISWQRANDSLRTSSDSSSYTSGVIDTEDAAYNAIAKNNGFTVLSGEGDSAVYYNPRTPYYYGLVKDSYEYSETTANKDKLPTKGTKILMIHNKTSKNGVGTAQKFTSSSNVTVPVNGYSLVEVWVLTNELKTEIDRTDYGAYVKLVNTVSDEKAPYVVKNINTQGNWAKISIYVEGSSLRESSYKIVLGLGMGSSAITDEYVEGYAYFDNVTVKEITGTEFEAAKATAIDNVSITEKANDDVSDASYEYKTEAVVSDTSGTTYQPNGEKSDSYNEAQANLNHLKYTVTYDIPSTSISTIYANGKANDNYVYPGSDYNTDYEMGSATFSAIKSKCDNVTNPLGDDAVTDYMILNSKGSLTFTTENRTVKDGKAYLLSFYIKVKTLGGQRALSIELVEKGTSVSPIDKTTALLNNITTVGYTDEATNDWAKVYIYVANHVGDDNERTYALNFHFGPTEQVSDSFLLPQGYVLLTGYEQIELTRDQFANEVSNNSSYSSITELGSDILSAIEDEDAKTDSYELNYSSYDKLNISNKLSTSVIGYTGVVAGHKMIGGEKEEFTQADTISGIFNTKYLNEYTEFTAEEKDLINSLEKDGENKYLQALAIKNTAPTAYGYIGTQGTVSATNTSQITIKLKVSGDAKAYVYLVDSEQLNGFGVLGLSAKKWTFNDETKETVYEDEDAFDTSKTQYVHTVTASECPDGWTEVNFVITAGISEIPYRVEIWNGARDGSDNSQGLIIVDSVTTNTADTKSLIMKANAKGDVAEEISYKQAPTKVTYTDDDGNEQIKYTKYNSKVVFSNYKATNTIIATHATIDVENEADETTNEDTGSTETTEENANSFNWALQITTIIIAVLLIVALVAVFVRMLLKNKQKKVAVTKSFYDKNSRDKTNLKIAKDKRARKEAEALKKAEELEKMKAEAEAKRRAEAEAERLAKEQAEQDAEERARIAQEEQRKALELEQQELNGNNEQSYDYDNMENNIVEDEVSETAETTPNEDNPENKN